MGTRLDDWINDALVGVGVAMHRFLTTLAPQKSPVRPAWMDDNPLADAEAERDSWEPDELFAASLRGREKAAAEDLLSKLADAQNEINDIITPTVKRPFEDTDDFAVGEHPDIDPQAVIGKRRHWDGIGGYPPSSPAGGGESEAPAASGVTNIATKRAANLAAVKRILDDRLDAAEVEPFEKWLTITAAEILNAVNK